MGSAPSSGANIDQTKVEMTEATFHKISDKTLEAITDYICVMEDLSAELSAVAKNLDEEEIDISSSQGVLNINLGPKIGIWVINKQTPNRQIWWSSPVSGPRRYEYSETKTTNPDSDRGYDVVRAWKYALKPGEMAAFGNDSTLTANGEIDLLESLRSEVLLVTGVDCSKIQ
jgi:frataxin-like iron-binding protein CyaY